MALELFNTRWADTRKTPARLARTAKPNLSESVIADPTRDERRSFADLLNILSGLPGAELAVGKGLMGLGGLGVIKQKGGNWLSGSVEDALKGLKQTHQGSNPNSLIEHLQARMAERPDLAPGDPTYDTFARSVEQLQPKAAINNWIDKQLTRYVKNQMATPEDPVRALAERGVLHVSPEQLPFGGRLVHPSGEDLQKLGVGENAKRWENSADHWIYPEEARTFKRTKSGVTGRPTIERNPWLEKLSDETPVYDLIPNPRTSDLGFPHLIDELSNALNPQSGLPHNLLLRPEQLQNLGMEGAVQRVADINSYRTKLKAEADALRANNAATVLHKEYPENNPIGLRWVELRPGDTLNPEYELKQIQGKNGAYWDLRKPGAPYGHTTNTEEEALRASNRQALQDALKYEGDTMGHCVGGYCEDVLSGRSRIYSLRDAKGQPHVTIEVQPPRSQAQLEESMRRRQLEEDFDPEDEALLDEFIGTEMEHPRIVQIKGKQNRAPNEEYLPFVQDFVRSGKWSDVGDLQNTGDRKSVV